MCDVFSFAFWYIASSSLTVACGGSASTKNPLGSKMQTTYVRTYVGAFARKGSRPTIPENFAPTILTFVPSWGHEDPDAPPKRRLLFQGDPYGRTVDSIRNEFEIPQ